MNKTNSILEVNGNRYDAVTGQLLSAGNKVRQSTAASSKKMIDGFVMGAHNTKRTLKKPLTPAGHHALDAQGVHHKPQRPKTLIRKAVKKPNGNKPEQSNNLRRVNIDHKKLFRASTTEKNSKVNRFGHFAGKQKSDVLVAKAVARPVAGTSPSPVQVERMPSMVMSVSQKKLEKLLDEALLKADAHKQMMNVNSRSGLINRLMRYPKWLSFGLVAFLLAVIAAFLIWQNLPTVAVHVAAAKAHVNASIPTYTPSGFSFVGPLEYAKGTVTMQFKDKTDADKTFLLTQKASNWNSTSLEENVLPKEANVQTSEVNGTTVYIYGDSNDAMWVNNSVLYNLKNKAQLSSDQVLKIVQGL